MTLFTCQIQYEMSSMLLQNNNGELIVMYK